jgi:hypothetical protein
MIEVGLAKSKNEAFNLFISYGIEKAKDRIKKEERVKELTEKWLKESLPYELPTSEDVINDRE